MRKRIFLIFSCLVILFSITSVCMSFILNDNSENIADNSIPSNYLSNTSFIEDTDIFTAERDQWPYINKYFASYSKTENNSNFHSIGTTSYPNINGKTVTVDTLYRQYQEALNDPNYSMGMLLFQAIKYKIKYPEKEVNIFFSAYRISVTTAVCLNPNSPYFGYIRSIYDGSDYDENGFVKIGYLFVEAAKMGINVTIVGHECSYSVKQYDNETNTTYYPTEPSYITYFSKSMSYDCYSKYANEKKVSDYLNFKAVNWARVDKANVDVMHIKTLAVSNYIDKYDKEHESGVWFSSTNLDSVYYTGANGNNGTQAGVIVSDHKKIYQITSNYINLMSNYAEREDVFALRRLAIERNTTQIDLILNGREDEIPEEEQIVYLGSETDDIFELYFTPLGGDVDTWDVSHNPYAKYFQEFYESTDYVEVVWNNPNFIENFFLSQTIVDIIYEKFVTNSNLNNRLGIRCQNSDFEGFDKLKSGENIGFVNVKTTFDRVHNKDVLLSYELDGVRKYVSILNSCNFNIGAVYYQFNQILVIKETEETDNIVYRTIGNAASKGAIIDSGQEFSSDERLVMNDNITSLPLTFEAEFTLSQNNNEDSYGRLFSNNDQWNYSLTYAIDSNGSPQIIFGIPEPNSAGIKVYKQYKYTFDEVLVATGEKVHLSIAIDQENNALLCYLNGVLKQTINEVNYLDNDYISYNEFVIGGDHLGSNYDYFEGTLYGLSIWSDIRTADEVLNDYKNSLDLSDTNLLASYNFTKAVRNSYVDDMSVNDNDFEIIKLWLDETNVEEVADYAYSFAVIGDTQALSWFHPNGINSIYDWLVANKDEHKIEHVIGLGDITEKSYDNEWEYVKENIYKLNDVISYSLVMGNHDKYDQKSKNFVPEDRTEFKFNQYFYETEYLNNLDGWYAEGDVSCSYKAIEVGSSKWLILNLDYGPNDSMLAWAGNIIEQYSDYRVIIVTHAYLYHNGTTLDSTECYPASGDNLEFNDGDEIWNELVSKYKNISLVLSGHDPWDHIVCSQIEGDNGNTVTQMLINPQYMDKYYGETGMIALLYFSKDGKTMTVRYYSTVKEMYGSELSQFTITIE